MKNLLLIGAGQLGSRYIQSIVKEELSYNVVVVDQSDNSLNIAKKRWVDAGGENTPHKILWTRVLPKEINAYDLAIISTSSKNRASLINYIASQVNITYWVLEKILAQSKMELDIIDKATNGAKKVYVNTPRRQMTWFKKIKSEFPEKPFQIIKSGGLWGLACNAIHYIDLVTWWTGETLISIDCNELNNDWLKSKREGYFEVTGKLYIKYSEGTELILQSSKDIIENILKVKFINNEICDIFEKKGDAFFSNGKTVNGKLELQSEMAGPMITKILTQGFCELPTLEDSSKMHAIFLNSMLSHWNTSNKKNDKLVPIT